MLIADLTMTQQNAIPALTYAKKKIESPRRRRIRKATVIAGMALGSGALTNSGIEAAEKLVSRKTNAEWKKFFASSNFHNAAGEMAAWELQQDYAKRGKTHAVWAKRLDRVKQFKQKHKTKCIAGSAVIGAGIGS
ncbi:MAG: hypothetical protein PHD95_04765 [Candidatus ainarchaeum sp.]|nr:hypothetical protein [Candidatus ainarchaeum sp.]